MEENPPLPPDDPPEPASEAPALPADEQPEVDTAGPSILGQDDAKQPAMTAAEEEALLKVTPAFPPTPDTGLLALHGSLPLQWHCMFRFE